MKGSPPYDPKAIIVFGSIAKGTSTEGSDIDIAVIPDSDLSEHNRNVGVRVCIGPIGTAMDLMVFTPEEVESEKANRFSLIAEILNTGTIVYGSV